MYITLGEAKKHLNIDEDFRDDDGYLLDLIDAAERAVSLRIDRPLAGCLDVSTGRLAGSVRQQILLLMGTFYSQREATTPVAVKANPLTLEYLADLERRYTVK